MVFGHAGRYNLILVVFRLVLTYLAILSQIY